MRLPADPVLDVRAGLNDSEILRLFSDAVSKLRAIAPSRNATVEVNTPKDLETSTQVFVQVEVLRRPLQPAYAPLKCWNEACRFISYPHWLDHVFGLVR